jgi:hypothetical protein
MPILREAVEKKRQHYIHLLIKEGIFNKEDTSSQTLTLTELQLVYKKYSSDKMKIGER